MRRWARIAAYLMLALGSLELLWYFAANHYLQSQNFHQLLQRDGNQISMESVSSLLPGHIHIKGFVLQNPELRLELPELKLEFSLLALAGKKIIFWSARSQGGSLLYQPHHASSSPPGSGGGASGAAKPADQAWTVHFQRLSFRNLQNLTIGSFTAKGPIDFETELHIAGQDKIKMQAGRLRIQNTETLWKDQKLAHIQNLQGRFELEPFNRRDEFLRKLSLDLTGRVELEQGEVLQNFVIDAPWLKIRGLHLNGTGHIVLKNGELIAPTQLAFQAGNLQLELWKESVAGEGTLTINVDQSLKLGFQIPTFTVADGSQDRPTVSGRDLSLQLETQDRDLLSRERTWQAALDLPGVTVQDLRYFNHFLPQGLGFQFKSGHGQLQLHLDSSRTKGNFIRMQAPQAQVTYDQQEFYGRIQQQLNIGAIDFVQEGFTVPSGELSLNVRPGGENSKEKAWTGQLSIRQGRVEVTPARFEGELQLKAADLRPLLWIFDPRSKLPQWARQFFQKDSLGARFHLKADESSYAIDGLEAETADLKLEAWYQASKAKKRGKLFVRYGSLSAGIAVNDDAFKVQLLSSRQWFQNRQ